MCSSSLHSTVRRPVYNLIMNNDEKIVVGQVDVKFQMAGSHLERQVKGRKGVLWGIRRRTAMGNNQKSCQDTYGTPEPIDASLMMLRYSSVPRRRSQETSASHRTNIA